MKNKSFTDLIIRKEEEKSSFESIYLINESGSFYRLDLSNLDQIIPRLKLFDINIGSYFPSR